jgi:molybdate transport system substrate-binding protein
LLKAKFLTNKLSLVIVLLLGLAACNSQESGSGETDASGSGRLVIFSAASLTEAFTELAQTFKLDHPEVEIILNFAGSQQLAQQLSQGAPADIFASANERQMEAAITAERVSAGSEQIFATNRLVIIFPADNPENIESINDLANPDLRLILAAPEVPVGQYAQDFLEMAAADPAYGPAFMSGVEGNIVSYEENVRAVLSKVVLGEADAGIVYQSDLSAESAESIGRLSIPDSLNKIATYPIAPISSSSRPELAAEFIEFVLSSAGQAILADFGFSPPT